MDIIFLDSDTISLNQDIDFKPLREQGNLKLFSISNQDNPADYVRDAEVIITNKIVINADTIRRLEALKLICVIATGYNNVDTSAAKKYNKLVANVPGYAQHSVSQHTFALILNLATSCCRYAGDVNGGLWQKSRTFNMLSYPGFELYGKTIGIIGFGTIGRAVAGIAEGFGMKVLAHDVGDISDTGYSNTEFEQLIKESDIISLHCPLTDKTRDLISAREFGMMKNTAIIINTARGGIINEQDLASALKQGQISGAGIDVLGQEPPKDRISLLRESSNIMVTPHCAWSARETRQRLVDITSKNIQAFRQGHPVNLV